MSSEEQTRKSAAAIGIVVIVAITALVLRFQGRLWTCACGEVYIWAGDIWSAHNSQQLFDPYAFTHALHGFLLFWGLTLVASRLWPVWQLVLAVLLESVWEIIENAQFIIDRYRAATISIGYSGDTILNSTGDIIVCILGFLLAKKIGFRPSLVIFFLTELVLLIWIRDSLILNVIMLVYPVEAIMNWQLG